jgi:hypothetical protein
VLEALERAGVVETRFSFEDLDEEVGDPDEVE